MSNHAQRKPNSAANKVKKLKAQLTEMQQTQSQLRFGLLNMRQMYEASVQEKAEQQREIGQLKMFLTALVLQEGKKGKLVLKETTIEGLPRAANLEYSQSEKPAGVQVTVEALEIEEEEDTDE